MCFSEYVFQTSLLNGMPLRNQAFLSARPISSFHFPRGISWRIDLISERIAYNLILHAFWVSFAFALFVTKSTRYFSFSELSIFSSARLSIFVLLLPAFLFLTLAGGRIVKVCLCVKACAWMLQLTAQTDPRAGGESPYNIKTQQKCLETVWGFLWVPVHIYLLP